ncbi:hypothetical protein BURMUCF2_0524 [Burkholderia multivorans CF2]|nr:hypothetical protein BURMUCF2_0524 [Burkholderia multivorans CF2]
MSGTGDQLGDGGRNHRRRQGKTAANGPPHVWIVAAPAPLGSAFRSYRYPVPEPMPRVYVDFTIRNWFYYS